MQYFLKLMVEISTAISVSTNGLLIYLIIRKSPRSLGSYKYLMIFMSAIEMMYSLVFFSVKAKMITKGFYWISATDSNRSLVPLPVAYILLLFYGGSYGVALASFEVHFIFRYLTATGFSNKKWVTGTKPLCLWLGIPVLSGLIFICSLHFCSQSDAATVQFVEEQIAQTENVAISEIVFLGFTMSDTADGYQNGSAVLQKAIGVLAMMTVIAVSFSAIIYFGTNTYLVIRKLSRSNGNHSSRLRSLQSQLFYSLVLQSIIPIVLVNVPSSVAAVKLKYGTAIEIDGYIVSIASFLFPAVDPLPNLIIIKPYRNAIKDMTACLFRRTRHASSGNTGSRIVATRKSVLP